MTRSCLACGKEFYTKPSRVRDGRGKYCSRSCSDPIVLIKGKPPTAMRCVVCGCGFYARSTRMDAKFCSRGCQVISRKGIPAHNASLVERECKNCKRSFRWKDSPSRIISQRGRFCSKSCYNTFRFEHITKKALHRWVERSRGKPSLCEFCRKTTGIFHWANKSNQYLKILSDWIRLCPSCHKKYDIAYRLSLE